MTDELKPVAYFILDNDWGYQQVASEFNGDDDTIPLYSQDTIDALVKERDEAHKNINLKAEFIDKTINQMAEMEEKLTITRQQTIAECAKVADALATPEVYDEQQSVKDACGLIAIAIRALGEKK